VTNTLRRLPAGSEVARGLVVGTIALLVLSVFAFWPTYLSRPLEAVDGYTHLHAAAGLLWLLLLITQGFLAWSGALRAHRLLGRVSYGLGPMFVVSSLLLGHFRFSRMDPETFAREGYSLYLPLSAAGLFALAFALAVRWRRVAALHARLMASTALLLVDPVLGRALAFHVVELPQAWHYQLITFGIEALVLFAMTRSLATATPRREVFVRFASLYAVVLALWFWLPRTEVWMSFARWFRELPIT
jgi:hypothetical protein